MQIQPNHGKAYFRAASSLTMLGHHDRAAQLLQHAAQVDRINALVRFI